MSRTGTPEAHALLATAGVAPKPAPRQPHGADDERFSPIASRDLSHRLLEVKRFLEQLLTCHLHQGPIAHGEHLSHRCSGWTEEQHRQRSWASAVT